MKTNTLQSLIVYFIVLFAILSLNACTSVEKESIPIMLKERTDPTPLNFIGHWQNEELKEQMVRNVTRKFEFENQDIRVNLKFPEEIYFDRNEEGSHQNFVASICQEENPAWDIIMINNDYENIRNTINDVDWAKKYLVDFSTIPEFQNHTIPELLTDSVKNLWSGIIPGPFIDGVNYALWVNKAVAEKIGIEVKQFEMTFDDFYGYIKAIGEYNQTHDSKILPIYESKYWVTTPAIAQQLYLSAIDDPNEFFADTVTENKLSAWYKTLQALEKLAPYNPLPERSDIAPWDQGKMMGEDQCLFFSNGSWMYNIWLGSHKHKMKDFIPTEYPTFKTTNYYIGGYYIPWAVLKNSPHRDEAVKFLLEWSKPYIAQEWVENTKSPTGIKGTFIESNFGVDQYEAYTTYIKNKYGARKYPLKPNSRYILGEKNRYLPNYYEEVMRGELTADLAIEKIRNTVGM